MRCYICDREIQPGNEMICMKTQSGVYKYICIRCVDREAARLKTENEEKHGAGGIKRKI